MIKHFIFFAGCMCATMTAVPAQTLLPAYDASSGLPARQGWQSMRFDTSMNNSASVAAPSAITVDASSGKLRLSVTDAAKFAQMGWIKPNTGFNADIGFTAEFRAKVTQNTGGFNVQGVDAEGRGFRVALTPTDVLDATNPLLPPTILNSAALDNSGGFHTYRIVLSGGDTLRVWRDNVLVGKTRLQSYKGDNWFPDGGFENTAAGAAPQGWTAWNGIGYGSTTVKTGSHSEATGGYAHSGSKGLHLEKGSHRTPDVPLKTGAHYDFSFWDKTLVFNEGDDAQWRDGFGYSKVNPDIDLFHAYTNRGTVGQWYLYDRTNRPESNPTPPDGAADNLDGYKWDRGVRGPDGIEFYSRGNDGMKNFYMKFEARDENNDASTRRDGEEAIDDILLTERIEPSRIPEGAVNLFPNGGFEDETQIRTGGYTQGADDDDTYVANCIDRGCPDWHRLWKCRVRLESNDGADGEAGFYWAHTGKYALRYFGRERAAAYGTQDASVWEGRGENTDMDYAQDLEAGKTYTFSFWYKSFRWGDHIKFKVLNGDNVLWSNDNISSDKYPFWENVLLTFTATDNSHTLRLRTEQHGSDPGAVYLDDLFLFEGQPLLPANEEYDKTFLFFGKSIGREAVDVEVESLSYTAEGAFAPSGEQYPAAAAVPYAKKTAPLMTNWGEAIPDNGAGYIPFDDAYPRPQMERAGNFHNLNGIWELAKKSNMQGFGTYGAFVAYTRSIMVPYPIESALSGIKDEDYNSVSKTYAYRRTFTVADEDRANGKRIILHFGAVDWEAHVFVNGQSAGSHAGGYDPFSFDITDYLHDGAAALQELVVQVWDPTAAGNPSGKQTSRPQGIWYTPSSGIWQTVWYESVAAAHIQGLKITPDVDNREVKVMLNVSANTPAGALAGVTVFGTDPAIPVASVQNMPASTEFSITIPEEHLHLWSPASPFLYRVKIALKNAAGVTQDSIGTYFGMRKITLGTLRGEPYTFLNDQPVFHFGTLDQGYFPDGLHTAPNYEALRFDIEKTKEQGFNMIRKHIKVEPARWYYYCDSIGIMVWQDMPTPYDDELGRNGNLICKASLGNDPAICASSSDNSDDAVRRNFLRESGNIVRSLINAPSIVTWIPYNEGWGQYNSGDLDDPNNIGFIHTRAGVDSIRLWDNTRLLNAVSGWHHYPDEGGDFYDKHDYGSTPALHPKIEGDTRARVIGEGGGLGFGIEDHIWGAINNPYGLITQGEMFGRINTLGSGLFSQSVEGINGFVYTQITDVEEELNGLWTYDRKVRKTPDSAFILFKDVIEKLQTRALPSNTVSILPAAGEEGYNETWSYLTGSRDFEEPEGWESADCIDDSGWRSGRGGFGAGSPPGSVTGTAWNSGKILLRKKVTIPNLTDEQKAMLKFSVYHDEEVEIYINGVLAASASGYTSNWVSLPVTDEGKAAVRYGECNLLAVRCRQSSGGQYIDAGLILSGEEIALDANNPEIGDAPQAAACAMGCPFGLSALSIRSAGGTLTPDFSEDIMNYTVNVPNSTKSILISAQAYGGELSGDIGVKSLNAGDNNFSLRVTSSEGGTKTYAIRVSREFPTAVAALTEQEWLAAYRTAGGAVAVCVSAHSEVWIYDLLGSLVKTFDVESEAQVLLPEGVYIVKAVSGSREKAVKVLNYGR
jgi:hypothetical protein